MNGIAKLEIQSTEFRNAEIAWFKGNIRKQKVLPSHTRIYIYIYTRIYIYTYGIIHIYMVLFFLI